MSIASISGGSNPWLQRSSDAASAAPPGRHRREAANESESAERPGRRNPLVAAMMQALQSLMPASSGTATTAPSAATSATATGTAAASTAAATTTTTADTATPATDVATPTDSPSTDAKPAVDLKQAAMAFAHELFHALKGNGQEGGDGDSGRGYGRGHGHHHHHGSDRAAGSGYGDLAQRLEALAQQLGGTSTPAAAGTATTATAAAPSAGTDAAAAAGAPTTPAASTTAAAGATAATAATTLTGQGLSITIHIELAGGTAAKPTPATGSDSRLLSAFKDLLNALNPTGSTAAPSSTTSTSTESTASTSTVAPASTPAQKLAAFLHQMAQALSPSAAAASTSLPATGSLLNVTA